MAEQGIERWAVPLALGITTIGVAGYIIYQVFVGPQAALVDEYKKLLEDYLQELDQFNRQTEGALTIDQEEKLKRKEERLKNLENQILTITRKVASIITILGIAGAIAIIIRALKVSPESISRAIRYFRENAPAVQTTEGLVALCRSTVNLAYADLGMISLATAAQTSTEMWASTVLYPSMQAAIATLSAQLPALTGFELTLAQYMISALQTQMTVTIPTFFTNFWGFIPPV